MATGQYAKEYGVSLNGICKMLDNHSPSRQGALSRAARSGNGSIGVGSFMELKNELGGNI